LFLALTILASTGCVLDRTGYSATSSLEREMALQEARTNELQKQEEESAKRLEQLEDIAAYRGERETERVENMDQLRALVRTVRGELEVLDHRLEKDEAFTEDADYRLTWLEMRVEALERNLGVKAPPPPERAGGASAEVEAPEGCDDSEDCEGEECCPKPDDPSAEGELPDSPDELVALARERLTDGRPRVARAILERYLDEHEGHKLYGEALYHLAETYYNDKQFQQAVLRYQDVVDAKPSSGWAQWSMVRQGQCFAALGKKAEAELFWEDIVNQFPRSKAAAEAKKLLGR